MVLYVFPTDALCVYGQGMFLVEGVNATAGIFATYPSSHLSLLNGVLDQVSSISLFLYGLCVFNLTLFLG